MSRSQHLMFVALCERELRLCGVHEGETVVILSQQDERIDYADAFMAAARRLGASTFHVRLADASAALVGEHGAWMPGRTPLSDNEPALEALRRADLLIDLVFLLFSEEQLELQASGTRVLLCVEPIDTLARLFPTADQRRRVEVSDELLRRARTLRFTNAAGTDVTYRLGPYEPLTEYGYTDTAGRWDHWPSGMLLTGGADDGVDGRVVVGRGDIIITPFKTYVAEPIEITIERGRILDVRGGVEAELLRDYITSFDDKDAYGIAHIGWGCNEKAWWSALKSDRRGHGMESRAFYGNVLFSTGPNRELGGPNHSACHIDIPMRACTLFLDDEPIIVEGEFTLPELRAARPAFGPASAGTAAR